MQYLHMHYILRQNVHRVDKNANSRDNYSSPEGIFLWWIKFHGFHSFEMMVDKVLPARPVSKHLS